jgi:hypothetical protein
LTLIELLLYVLLNPVRGESILGLDGGWSRVCEPLEWGKGGKATFVRERDGDLRLGDLVFAEEDAVVELDWVERSRRGEALESVDDMEGPSSDIRDPERGRSGSGGRGSLSASGERRPFLLAAGAESWAEVKEPRRALVLGAELTRRRNRAAAEVALLCWTWDWGVR